MSKIKHLVSLHSIQSGSSQTMFNMRYSIVIFMQTINPNVFLFHVVIYTVEMTCQAVFD